MPERHTRGARDFRDNKPALPAGVFVHALVTHRDGRGALTELFRDEWDVGLSPLQWNAVASEAGVLRGVHVHVRHADYLVVVAGRMLLGLKDLRAGSPTEGLACLLELSADPMRAVTIPTGVAHGFFFPERAMHVYAVSHYWNPADELGCHWADSELGIAWPVLQPILSERDAGLPSLATLVEELRGEHGI